MLRFTLKSKAAGSGLCGQDRRHRNIAESRTDAGGRNVGDLERAGTVFPHATAKKSCDFLQIGEKPWDLRHHLESIFFFLPFFVVIGEFTPYRKLFDLEEWLSCVMTYSSFAYMYLGEPQCSLELLQPRDSTCSSLGNFSSPWWQA